ncbi:hypothetical protein HPDP_00173 [Candidatus Hepatincola sp. Pdp]
MDSNSPIKVKIDEIHNALNNEKSTIMMTRIENTLNYVIGEHFQIQNYIRYRMCVNFKINKFTIADVEYIKKEINDGWYDVFLLGGKL